MMLSVTGLTTGYGRKKILDGISFEFEEKLFYGVIGPNGSGKSTLFKSMAGVLKPWEGKVRFNGLDICSTARKELARHLACVPQFQEVHFPYKVRDFIMMGRYPHRGRFGLWRAEDNRIVDDVLCSTETFDIASKLISELSGGEFQRVCIAQALAQSPKMLLLDEPTSHLDIGRQIMMLELLRDWRCRHGITVIAILHDLNIASAYCEKLILLDTGRIVSAGEPGKVLTKRNIDNVYKTDIEVAFRDNSAAPDILLKKS